MTSIRRYGGQSGANIIDEAFGPSWNGDINNGASRNSIYQYLITLGVANLGRVWFLSTNDANALGEVGNINKPTGANWFTYIVNSLSLAGDTFVFLPGTYDTFSFIIPKKNQNYVLINATYNCAGYNGNIVCLNNTVNDRAENVQFVGIGNSSINKTSTNVDWGVLSPYFYCKMDFKNLTISSPGFLGNMFPTTANRVRFINCDVYWTDNTTTGPSGGYWTAGQIEYHGCYISGTTSIGEGASDYGYALKAYRSNFEAIINATGTVNSNITLYDDSLNVPGKEVYLEDCNFTSTVENITSWNNSPLYVPTRNILVSRCKFVNGANGWIRNLIDLQPFKLTPDSYSTNNASGFPVVNLYPGAGVQTVANLQV